MPDSEPRPSYPGPLSVNPLPSDARKVLCKGAVCFSYNTPSELKIYFANPEDASIYHVADFEYVKYGLNPKRSWYDMGCTVVGSKIYLVAGKSCAAADPLWVFSYNVAKQSRKPDGSYKWKKSPRLQTHKHRPLLFSLAGNIYVLSVGSGRQCCDGFEVLRAGEKKCQVLQVPESVIRYGTGMLGSFVYEDSKKIIIHITVECIGSLLCIYDAENDSWQEIEHVSTRPLEVPSLLLSACDCDSWVGKPFVFDVGHNYAAYILGRSLGFKLESLFGDKEEDSCDGPLTWHVIGLKDSKLCFIALYSDSALPQDRKAYVRFGTFDLVQRSSRKKKKQRTSANQRPRYKIQNRMFKIVSLREAKDDTSHLMPNVLCCKV